MRTNSRNFFSVLHRNTALFYFMLVSGFASKLDGRAGKIWKCIGLLARAYSLPDNEFEQFKSNRRWRTCLSNAAINVVKLVKDLYGPYHCTYNLHQLLHLKRTRLKGPFPSTSTFSNESYYNNVRRSVMDKPSYNVGKQVLEDTYLSYHRYHKCQKQLVLTNKAKGKYSDRHVYQYDEQSKAYIFYLIKDCGDDDTFICTELITDDINENAQDRKVFPFHCTGAFELVGELRSDLVLKRDEITGKAIVVGDNIFSIAPNTLFECQ